MRFTKKTISIVGVLFCLNFPVFAQDISLNIKNVTVKEAMEHLKEASGYSFVFSSSDVNTQKQISIHATNATIEEVVNQILQGQNGISYEIQGKKIVISHARQQDNNAQKHKISGRVLDENGEAVIGASILEQGTNNGTISDLNGNFTLEVTQKDAQLEISYIGYQTLHVTSASDKPLAIVLKENSQALDEVVVLAYGTQTKRNVTGSLETVDFDKLGDIPGAQFAQKLQGQISGVQINQGTGTLDKA